MKTKTYTVYSFAELSADAKQAAMDRFAANYGYTWADETLSSLKALAEHFGGKLGRYEIDWFKSSYSQASFDMPEMEPEEIQSRLDKLGEFDPVTLRGHGSCVLTSFCADEDAIDGFRRAWFAGERDLNGLMQSAFRSWLESAQADCAAQYTEEVFGEFAEANGYTFTEDGKLD